MGSLNFNFLNRLRSMKKILFLCTGNYYRSRLAEELFNHLAIKNDLPWRAWSEGLGQRNDKIKKSRTDC